MALGLVGSKCRQKICYLQKSYRCCSHSCLFRSSTRLSLSFPIYLSIIVHSFRTLPVSFLLSIDRFSFFVCRHTKSFFGGICSIIISFWFRTSLTLVFLTCIVLHIAAELRQKSIFNVICLFSFVCWATKFSFR